MAVAVAVARAAMAVVRLSNEDESGDPITPDSQTGRTPTDGAPRRTRTTCKVSQGHRGIRQAGGRAGPVTDEWMRRGRYQNNRLRQILGSKRRRKRKRDGRGRGRALNHDGENGHRSLSAVEVALARARQLCILGERKRSRQANGNEFYLLLACAASPARAQEFWVT